VQNVSAMWPSTGKSSQKCTKESKMISNQACPLQISLSHVELFKKRSTLMPNRCESLKSVIFYK